MHLIDSETTPVRIYDIIRTGPDFSNYWKFRPFEEKSRPTDLRLKLPLHVDTCSFQPIPVVNAPGEDLNISADWLTTIIGSTEIRILTATSTTCANELVPTILPLIITRESLAGLVTQMENMCVSRLQESDAARAMESKISVLI